MSSSSPSSSAAWKRAQQEEAKRKKTKRARAGRPPVVGEDGKVWLQCRIDAAIRERVRELSIDMGVTMTKCVEVLLETHVDLEKYKNTEGGV